LTRYCYTPAEQENKEREKENEVVGLIIDSLTTLGGGPTCVTFKRDGRSKYIPFRSLEKAEQKCLGVVKKLVFITNW
jgi:hypothetical protein